MKVMEMLRFMKGQGVEIEDDTNTPTEEEIAAAREVLSHAGVPATAPETTPEPAAETAPEAVPALEPVPAPVVKTSAETIKRPVAMQTGVKTLDDMLSGDEVSISTSLGDGTLEKMFNATVRR